MQSDSTMVLEQSIMSNETNTFEELCLLASREEWCWKLHCTTCGHTGFRYAFRELANGKSPLKEGWLIHKHVTQYPELGDWRQRLTSLEVVQLVDICTSAQVANIASRCKFPDWLGYLGLVLQHVQHIAQQHRRLSQKWSEQLLKVVKYGTPAYARLSQIVDSNTQVLLPSDLELVERAIEENH